MLFRSRGVRHGAGEGVLTAQPATFEARARSGLRGPLAEFAVWMSFAPNSAAPDCRRRMRRSTSRASTDVRGMARVVGHLHVFERELADMRGLLVVGVVGRQNFRRRFFDHSLCEPLKGYASGIVSRRNSVACDEALATELSMSATRSVAPFFSDTASVRG